LTERAKLIVGSSPGLSHGTKMLGKRRTLHTKEAHERYLMSKNLISRLAGQEKNGTADSLGGSGLK
jgi:hypothetical protein